MPKSKPKPAPTHETRAAAWTASFKDLDTPFGLRVATLKLDGGPAGFVADPFQFHLEKPAKVEAVVRSEDLEAFLNKTLPSKIRELKLALVPGKLLIEAKVKVIVELQAKAVCTLRVALGKQLYVDLESVDVAGVGARNLVQKQLDAINPVFDADSLPLDVEIEGLEVQEGRIVVRGLAKPNA